MRSGKSLQFADDLILMCEEQLHVAGESSPCAPLLQIMVPWWFSPDTLTRLYSDMPDVAASVCIKQMKKILVTKRPASGR